MITLLFFNENTTRNSRFPLEAWYSLPARAALGTLQTRRTKGARRASVALGTEGTRAALEAWIKYDEDEDNFPNKHLKVQVLYKTAVHAAAPFVRTWHSRTPLVSLDPGEPGDAVETRRTGGALLS